MAIEHSRTHCIGEFQFPVTPQNIIAYWRSQDVVIIDVRPGNGGIVVGEGSRSLSDSERFEFEADAGMIRQAWFKNRDSAKGKFDSTNVMRPSTFKGIARDIAAAQANRLRGQLGRSDRQDRSEIRGRHISVIRKPGSAPLFVIGARVVAEPEAHSSAREA